VKHLDKNYIDFVKEFLVNPLTEEALHMGHETLHP
jgi:hypothetical protein